MQGAKQHSTSQNAKVTTKVVTWKGWLLKAGNENNRWRPRFLQLRGNILEYYDQPEKNTDTQHSSSSTNSSDARSLQGSLGTPRGWMKLEEVTGLSVLSSHQQNNSQTEIREQVGLVANTSANHGSQVVEYYASQCSGGHAANHIGPPVLIIMTATQVWRLKMDLEESMESASQVQATIGQQLPEKGKTMEWGNLGNLLILIERAVPRAVVRVAGNILARGTLQWSKRYALLLSNGSLFIFKDPTLDNLRRHVPLAGAKVIQPVNALARENSQEEENIIHQLQEQAAASRSSLLLSSLSWSSQHDLLGIRLIHPQIPEKKGYVFCIEPTVYQVSRSPKHSSDSATNIGSAFGDNSITGSVRGEQVSSENQHGKKTVSYIRASQIYNEYRTWVRILQSSSAEARLVDRLVNSTSGSKQSRSARLASLRAAPESLRILEDAVNANYFQKSPALVELSRAGFPNQLRGDIWTGFLNPLCQFEKGHLEDALLELRLSESSLGLYDSIVEGLFGDIDQHSKETQNNQHSGVLQVNQHERDKQMNPPVRHIHDQDKEVSQQTRTTVPQDFTNEVGIVTPLYVRDIINTDVVSMHQQQVECVCQLVEAKGSLAKSVDSISRVVFACYSYNPELGGIGYTTVLLPVICHLLLYRSECECFWVLQSLFGSGCGQDLSQQLPYQPKDYRKQCILAEYHTFNAKFMPSVFHEGESLKQEVTDQLHSLSMEQLDWIGYGAAVDSITFLQLLHTVLPQLHEQLNNLGLLNDVLRLVQVWYMSMFTVSITYTTVLDSKKQLSFCKAPIDLESCARVWDILVVEGSSTLHRIALSLFFIAKNELLQVESSTQLFEVFSAKSRTNVVNLAASSTRSGSAADILIVTAVYEPCIAHSVSVGALRGRRALWRDISDEVSKNLELVHSWIKTLKDARDSLKTLKDTGLQVVESETKERLERLKQIKEYFESSKTNNVYNAELHRPWHRLRDDLQIQVDPKQHRLNVSMKCSQVLLDDTNEFVSKLQTFLQQVNTCIQGLLQVSSSLSDFHTRAQEQQTLREHSHVATREFSSSPNRNGQVCGTQDDSVNVVSRSKDLDLSQIHLMKTVRKRSFQLLPFRMTSTAKASQTLKYARGGLGQLSDHCIAPVCESLVTLTREACVVGKRCQTNSDTLAELAIDISLVPEWYKVRSATVREFLAGLASLLVVPSPWFTWQSQEGGGTYPQFNIAPKMSSSLSSTPVKSRPVQDVYPGVPHNSRTQVKGSKQQLRRVVRSLVTNTKSQPVPKVVHEPSSTDSRKMVNEVTQLLNEVIHVKLLQASSSGESATTFVSPSLKDVKFGFASRCPSTKQAGFGEDALLRDMDISLEATLRTLRIVFDVSVQLCTVTLRGLEEVVQLLSMSRGGKKRQYGISILCDDSLTAQDKWNLQAQGLVKELCELAMELAKF